VKSLNTFVVYCSHDFEGFIKQKAKDSNYAFAGRVLIRCNHSSGYATKWVDYAWMGWVKAIELYA